MMAAFKDEIGPTLLRSLAVELTMAWADFPRQRFTRGLVATLEPLELLARIDAVSDRLSTVLPTPFPAAAAVLWRALDSPSFSGWMTLPCGTFIAKQGIDHPELSLPLLAGLTPRWSSEGPIRPFIEHHPEITYDHLRRWCQHDDDHVRRLVSEGTRPRLPWAPVLRRLVSDPSPNIPLLNTLAADPSPYVRRSVANHLNDISKDHPDLALELAERWLKGGDGAAWTARHGLRTLVKRGNRTAFHLLGATGGGDIELVELSVDRARITLGDTATLTFTIRLAPDHHPVDAIIDYRVHYVGARGVKAPKVFKLTRRRLQPGEAVTIVRRHRFDHVSIRRIHPGPHTIDVQVNGHVLGSAVLEVTEAA